MTSPTSTFVVDRNTLFREGLARIFAETQYRVEGSAASLGEVLEQRVRPQHPMLFLVGLDVEYELALGSLRDIKGRYPSSRLVVLVETVAPRQLALALRVGVDGFLLKSMTCEELLTCLDVVLSGKIVLSKAVRMFVDREMPSGDLPQRLNAMVVSSDALSEREAEIIQCLVRGEPNKAIARRFGIAEATVKVHVKAILRKLHASNRTQAAVWALDNQR